MDTTAKKIFVAIYCFDQDATSGAVAVDHMHCKLGSRIHFGSRFDVRVDSPLRRAINDVRSELAAPILDPLNEALIDGARAYSLAKPRSLSCLENADGQLVVPVEFQIEVPKGTKLELKDGYATFLIEGEVTGHNILGVRLCKYDFPYNTWHQVNYGEKEAYFAAKAKREATIDTAVNS